MWLCIKPIFSQKPSVLVKNNKQKWQKHVLLRPSSSLLQITNLPLEKQLALSFLTDFIVCVFVCVCVCMIRLPPRARQCLILYPLKSLNLSLFGALPSRPHTVSYLSPLPWPLIHPSGLHQFPSSAICCLLVLIRCTRFWLAHLAG